MKFNEYNKNFNKKLRGLKNSDPKSYWTLLNKHSGDKKKTLNTISSETFHEHFAKMNDMSNNDGVPPFNMNDVSDFNVELNKTISEAEISNAISRLKNNIACSNFDNILNEHLKY